MNDDDLIQDFWDEHAAWSAVATDLKASRTRWQVIVLSLTILGAALQTIAAMMHSVWSIVQREFELANCCI